MKQPATDRSIGPRLIWGFLLIVGGAILLLHNLGFVDIDWREGLLWPILFGLAGLAFLVVFISNPEHWWGLIPGFVFLSIATLVGLGRAAPGLAETWGGSIFLGGLSLSFWLIYLLRREHWWAVIPGGVLLTLAAVAGLDQFATGLETGGIFFLGLAATFGLVYLTPTPGGRMTWALIPAAVCLALGLTVLAAFTAILGFIWPIALVAIGLYLVWRSSRGSEASKPGSDQLEENKLKD